MLQRWMKKFLWTSFHLENFQFSRLFELVRTSPFLPRVASTLAQKMASFQILMDVEESDACDPKPARDGDAEGCLATRDYLSDGSSRDACKENNPPVTPTPSKRRRLGPHEGCSQEIREAGTPTLHSNVKEVNEAPLPPSGRVEAAHAVLIPQALDANVDLSAHSPSRKHQVFEAQSSSRPPPVDAAASLPPPPSSPFNAPPLPSLLETKPTDDDDGGSSVVKKKKQVRFGVPLSPEFFDKNLPPSTPLQKGGTPARVATPGGCLLLRSLLKTPQRSDSKTPQSQPDHHSPSDFGSSPTFAIPLRHRQGAEMVFPSFEETSSAAASDPDYLWDTQPLNLNSAFHEESLCQTETAAVSLEPDLQTRTSCWINTEDESGSVTETKEKPEAADEGPSSSTSNSRKKTRAVKKQVATASVRSGSRKRKQPEESQPVKRSTRSAAKSATGKMKTTLGGARRWSKEVDHSLYGSREYASKNPSLTPITEDLSFTSESPAAPPTPFVFMSAATDEAHQNPGTESPDAAEVRTLSWRSRRLSGPRARGRPLKKREVSLPGSNLLSEEKQICGDLTAAPGSPSEHNAPEKEDAAPASELTPERAPRSTLDVRSDSAPPADDPPAREEPRSAEPPVQKKRGRRSSALAAILLEQQNRGAEPQTVCDEATRAAEPAANQRVNIPEESRLTGEVLAPWQAEFNFEDVFKPVATRGQHTVRRSLRLRCDLERNSGGGGGEGLAWLPYTFTKSSKQARRKTWGRWPVQPTLPEVTQDAS